MHVDGLAEHGMVRGFYTVQAALHALALRHRQFFVDPALIRLEAIGIAVLGGDEHVVRNVAP